MSRCYHSLFWPEHTTYKITMLRQPGHYISFISPKRYRVELNFHCTTIAMGDMFSPRLPVVMIGVGNLITVQ